MELRAISVLRLRRAVLGVLLTANRPLTVTEILAELRAVGCIPWSLGPRPPNQLVADMLAYQVRAGRVRRTARATYAPRRDKIPSTTQWRCRRWRDGL